MSAQLRWACRRGMLELDIVLNHFLDNGYLHLSSLQQQQFVDLLTANDQELYQWLIQQQPANQQDQQTIINLVLANAHQNI